MIINKRAFLLIALITCPSIVFGGDGDGVNSLIKSIQEAQTIKAAGEALNTAVNNLNQSEKYVSQANKVGVSESTKQTMQKKIEEAIKAATTSDPQNSSTDVPSDTTRTDDEKAKALEEKTKAYEDAKENEQSLANRTLTATTIAATGLGGMELAEGLAAKKADEAADRDMTAYLETFRCTYGEGKQVKGGQTPVELPGGNNAELMKLRNEYIALAKDLKERKSSLGMQPGIESEEILDKAEMGLYDDENVGVTGGSYASLYRAKALGSEEDQKKLDEATKKAGDKIKGGAIAAGLGTVVGVAGNSLINGKLGEKLTELKNGKADTKDDKEVEKDLKKGLKDSGLSLVEVNKIPWKDFAGIGVLKDNVKNIEFKEVVTEDDAKVFAKEATKAELVGSFVGNWEALSNLRNVCIKTQGDGSATGTWDKSNHTCKCPLKNGFRVEWKTNEETQTNECIYTQS